MTTPLASPSPEGGESRAAGIPGRITLGDHQMACRVKVVSGGQVVAEASVADLDAADAVVRRWIDESEVTAEMDITASMRFRPAEFDWRYEWDDEEGRFYEQGS